jgi:regulator of protease activity HflC (stomatin/prohibitin superfamily)
MKNSYLDQVVAQKAQLENDLRARRAPMIANAVQAVAGGMGRAAAPDTDDGTRRIRLGDLAGASGGNALDIRITGFWRWKNVIVPPNAYVVHTRRGASEPLHCGLGVSFRFDPMTDTFIAVPASMQTIIINANCICRERQGILVQGYVQWIIDDFKTAYRKLDFGDAEDPMRVVNVQLREQAEAAIKDKVASMSIDEVLADKQPIIKELTARLRHVAEGDGADKGLGLRIVTVQIKEAVVCSPRVWEMLQRPFRAERSKEARLAELSNEAVVQARESEAEKVSAQRRIETEAEVARIQAEAHAAQFEREQADAVRRAKLESDALEQTIANEKAKLEKQAELARMRVEQELVEAGMRQEAENRQSEKEIQFNALRRKIDNELSATALQARLVEMLPAIAEKMPQPKELKSFQLGGADGLASLLGGILRMLEQMKTQKLSA